MDDYLELIKNAKPKPRYSVDQQKALNPPKRVDPVPDISNRFPFNQREFQNNFANQDAFSQIKNRISQNLSNTQSAETVRTLQEGWERNTSFITNAQSEIIRRPTGVQNQEEDSSLLGFSKIFKRNTQDPTINTDFDTDENENNTSVLKSGVQRRFNRMQSRISKIIIGLLIVFLLVLAWSKFSSKPRFCDTGDLSSRDCQLCPEKGDCKNGYLLSCLESYKIYRQNCVPNLDTSMRFSEYRKFINDKLVEKKGASMCDEKVLDNFDLDEIRTLINETYEPIKRGKTEFDQVWRSEFRNNQEGLVSSQDQYTYTTKDTGNPSFSCKMKLLIKDGKLFTLWILLFGACIVFAFRFVTKLLDERNIVMELYNEALGYLYNFEKVPVSSLQREFSGRYPEKNDEKLWNAIDKLMRKEGKVTSYMDYVDGTVKEFWTLGKHE